MPRRSRTILKALALLGAVAAVVRPARRFGDAVAAYVYGYPLVTMEMTRRVMTNAATVERMRAPMGRFVTARAYPDASFRDAPAPNADTLYTSAWLDVGREPWILSLPDVGDRYALFPMLDGWTDVFASPGTRTTGTAARRFAITGPHWRGTLPADVEECRSPTNLVWILGRIYCTGTPEDYAAVHALQDACGLAPLGADGTGRPPPAGVVDPDVDMTTDLRDVVNRLNAAAFFSLLAELMAANPPLPHDGPMLARLASLGIVPGHPLDRTSLARVPLLTRVPAAGLARILLHFRFGGTDMKRRDGWIWTLAAGRYGTNYAMRALIAVIGLGANGPEDAIYAVSKRDADGRAYDGAHRYVLRFPPGRLPPARGFWSVTLYDKAFYLVANPVGRHAVSARQQLVVNPDGSTDVHVAAERPDGVDAVNWLPAPRARFQLMLRLYWPHDTDPSILDGSWTMPPVRRVD